MQSDMRSLAWGRQITGKLGFLGSQPKCKQHTLEHVKAPAKALGLCAWPAEPHLHILTLSANVERAVTKPKFAFPSHDVFQLLVSHDVKLAAWIGKGKYYCSASGVS